MSEEFVIFTLLGQIISRDNDIDISYVVHYVFSNRGSFLYAGLRALMLVSSLVRVGLGLTIIWHNTEIRTIC